MIFIPAQSSNYALAPYHHGHPIRRPNFGHVYLYTVPIDKNPEEAKCMANEGKETKASTSESTVYQGRGIEVTKGKSHYALSLDLPGVKHNDLKVEVVPDEGLLTIEAKRCVDSAAKTFSRQFTFDEETADLTNAQASLVDGVLDIQIPTKEKVESSPLSVSVVAGDWMSRDDSATEMAEVASIDLPGVKLDHVKVEYFKDRLSVEAERHKGNKLVTKYQRVFALNSKRFDVTNIKATLADGVLTVMAPKKSAVPKQIVQVQKSSINQLTEGEKHDEFVNVGLPETVSDEEAAEDEESASNH